MESLEKLRVYVENHRHLLFDVLRMYLGVGLFAKGLHFVAHPDAISGLLEGSSKQIEILGAGLIGHYVGLAHLCGGLLLAIGLVTRVAALVQLPIVGGAIFLVHLRDGLFGRDQNLEFSILVAFLLVLFGIHGGGQWSADAALARKMLAQQRAPEGTLSHS